MKLNIEEAAAEEPEPKPDLPAAVAVAVEVEDALDEPSLDPNNKWSTSETTLLLVEAFKSLDDFVFLMACESWAKVELKRRAGLRGIPPERNDLNIVCMAFLFVLAD